MVTPELAKRMRANAFLSTSSTGTHTKTKTDTAPPPLLANNSDRVFFSFKGGAQSRGYIELTGEIHCYANRANV